jgi:LysR family transcriptional regulator, hydrogen peroxide-inducible genes activator
MEMHQVRYFLAVCETLNFTRAAERCNVAQPSLTRAIKNLEDELGGPLFHRERNQTHLTDLGKLMQPYIDQVWRQSEEAKTRAKGFVGMKDAPLSIGVMCTIGPIRLVDFMHRFSERHPGIAVHLRDGKGLALQEWLLNGELDLAIYGLPGELDDRLHAKPLFSERFVIAFGAGHRFQALNAVPMRELHGERYLSRVNCEFADHVRRIAEERGITPQRPYRSERDDWILAMVKAGLGYGFFPECAVTLDGVTTRPMVEPEIERTINLVTVRGRPHSPAVGAFMREAVAFKWQAAASPA